MCNQCIDCFFYGETPDDSGGEHCFLNPDKPVKINYFDSACPKFELSESAKVEQGKEPGEL